MITTSPMETLALSHQERMTRLDNYVPRAAGTRGKGAERGTPLPKERPIILA